ncbi:hypothetical protein KEM48_003514 [Puccinia striiformis f. sp. tritici PST-130]|nr:hypothetical protein KEM48_003514 [Puccinia striiformis f. sp. tritici PST-130]
MTQYWQLFLTGLYLPSWGIVFGPAAQCDTIRSGPFPIISSLATIAEEEDYQPEPAGATADDCESDGTDDSDEESDEEDEDLDRRPKEVAATSGPRRKANELHELTVNLDYVVRKITGSAPWRQKYKVIAIEKGSDVLDLIAGYGIRWNIKFESRTRAYNAREVIDQMLKEEFDKYVSKNARSHRSKKGKAGHFKGILFDANDWSMIKELNDELEPFAVLTKEMEGDGSTGALVLPKYYILKHTLSTKRDECDQNDPLYPMFCKMAEKTETYLKEALACESLVMATLLHPAFRLAAFEEFFPELKDRAEKTLANLFQDRKTRIASEKQANLKTTSNDAGPDPPIKPKSKIFNLFHSSSAKAENDELPEPSRCYRYRSGLSTSITILYDIPRQMEHSSTFACAQPPTVPRNPASSPCSTVISPFPHGLPLLSSSIPLFAIQHNCDTRPYSTIHDFSYLVVRSVQTCSVSFPLGLILSYHPCGLFSYLSPHFAGPPFKSSTPNFTTPLARILCPANQSNPPSINLSSFCETPLTGLSCTQSVTRTVCRAQASFDCLVPLNWTVTILISSTTLVSSSPILFLTNAEKIRYTVSDCSIHHAALERATLSYCLITLCGSSTVWSWTSWE